MKKFNSLTQLKESLEREGKEKIISFSGYELITDRFCYIIVLGELIMEKNKNGENR